MSHVSSGILAASLIALTLGFGQIAIGQNSIGSDLRIEAATASSSSSVNRTAKSDRIAAANSISGKSSWVMRPQDRDGMSIAMKSEGLPKKEAREIAPTTGAARKRAIACEPVVSILTEVARFLEPGRCLT